MDDSSVEILDMLDEGLEPDPEPFPQVDAQPVEEVETEPVALGAQLLGADGSGSGSPMADDWRDNSSYDHPTYQLKGNTAPLSRQIILATDKMLGAIDGAKSDLLASLPAGTSGTSTALDSSDVETLEGGTYTVVIAPDQWDELRDCWHYAKEYGSIATVSIVLQLGILAALLGSRMFGIFSDGWRYHA